jgi:hypothetical protein
MWQIETFSCPPSSEPSKGSGSVLSVLPGDNSYIVSRWLRRTETLGCREITQSNSTFWMLYWLIDLLVAHWFFITVYMFSTNSEWATLFAQTKDATWPKSPFWVNSTVPTPVWSIWSIMTREMKTIGLLIHVIDQNAQRNDSERIIQDKTGISNWSVDLCICRCDLLIPSQNLFHPTKQIDTTFEQKWWCYCCSNSCHFGSGWWDQVRQEMGAVHWVIAGILTLPSLSAFLWPDGKYISIYLRDCPEMANLHSNHWFSSRNAY